MVVTIDNLTHGTEVSVKIRGIETVGKLSVCNRGRIYVCHNVPEINGANAPDKLGYMYSWCIYTSGNSSLEEAFISNIVNYISILKKGKSKKHKQKVLVW